MQSAASTPHGCRGSARTGPAARNWHEELRQFLVSLGAKVGTSSPCVFQLRRQQRIIKIAVHGDDMACAGEGHVRLVVVSRGKGCHLDSLPIACDASDKQPWTWACRN